MKIKRTWSEDEAEVQMAPLIDCVFLLLIFFLVAATLKQAHNEVGVMVADSSAAATPEPSYDPMVVEVRQDGKFYLNYVPVSPQLMQEVLRTAAAENPDRCIQIDGDRRTAFQHIVHFLDLCRFEGMKNISFRVAD
jgi:biopolymer transport protein ExbD